MRVPYWSLQKLDSAGAVRRRLLPAIVCLRRRCPLAPGRPPVAAEARDARGGRRGRRRRRRPRGRPCDRCVRPATRRSGSPSSGNREPAKVGRGRAARRSPSSTWSVLEAPAVVEGDRLDAALTRGPARRCDPSDAARRPSPPMQLQRTSVRRPRRPSRPCSGSGSVPRSSRHRHAPAARAPEATSRPMKPAPTITRRIAAGREQLAQAPARPRASAGVLTFS